MSKTKLTPTKDRRDVGQVVFPIEKMLAARELSTCCLGTEAALETNAGFGGWLDRLRRRSQTRTD